MHPILPPVRTEDVYGGLTNKGLTWLQTIPLIVPKT